MSAFWQVIDAQLEELRSAATAGDVMRILAVERDPYGPEHSNGRAFFGGSGGDATVAGSLRVAGWRSVWVEASYHWCMVAPDGSQITYVEGDIYETARCAS